MRIMKLVTRRTFDLIVMRFCEFKHTLKIVIRLLLHIELLFNLRSGIQSQISSAPNQTLLTIDMATWIHHRLIST